MLFTVLLVAIAVFLRLAVGQSSRKSVGPIVAVIVAALVVGGAYAIRETAGISDVEAVD